MFQCLMRFMLHLDKHNNYSYCWYWKTCFLQKANSSLFMHQSVLLMCANPFWTMVPQRKSHLRANVWSVCAIGDTSNRNLTNGAPYFAADKHTFSYLRTVKCYKMRWPCESLHYWRHIKACTRRTNTVSTDTVPQPHRRTKRARSAQAYVCGQPSWPRETEPGPSLCSTELSLSPGLDWLSVGTQRALRMWTHTDAQRTHNKSMRGHTHTRTWMPIPRYEKDVNMQMILLVSDLKMRDEDEMRVN